MQEYDDRKDLSKFTLSGTKRKIEDDARCDDGADREYIEVECKQGDILFVNTQLWWHSTLIPPQEVPCISYARDVYIISKERSAGAASAEASDVCNAGDQHNSSMTNVDGTYAAEDIEADTVLFTENTMPDCELHRSKTDPNCQVIELEDEATGESYMAVVSLRGIKAGEFFTILESDEDYDDDDDGEEIISED